MRRILICVCLLVAAVSCSSKDKELKERALELCSYIPDHKLNPEAKDFMTPEFFRTLSEAWDAPDILGEIGYGEWLWYFVTGNGGGEPVYAVKSVTRKGSDLANAVITVRLEYKEDGYIEPEDKAREYGIVMKLVDDKWLLDDFDNKKAQCVEYIREQREKTESGEMLKYMESDEYLRELVPDFKKSVEEFYRKYGR